MSTYWCILMYSHFPYWENQGSKALRKLLGFSHQAREDHSKGREAPSGQLLSVSRTPQEGCSQGVELGNPQSHTLLVLPCSWAHRANSSLLLHEWEQWGPEWVRTSALCPQMRGTSTYMIPSSCSKCLCHYTTLPLSLNPFQKAWMRSHETESWFSNATFQSSWMQWYIIQEIVATPRIRPHFRFPTSDPHVWCDSKNN